MPVKELHTFLQADLEQVEALIKASLQSDIALLDSTNRMLREHPGKMLRPMLALLVAGACGRVNEDTVRFAAAAELLHNATLLHDDVVDGATERRGMPTVARMLSGSAAVLIGDYWLVKCMQTILGASRHSEQVLRVFSTTLGHLAEGELLQMEKASSGDTTQKDYERIIFNKTASLFEATARSAAISVDATDDQLFAVSEFARLLGMAFQIRDDILDYAGQASAVGKALGIDLLEQKITQPLLCALEDVSPEEARAIRQKVTCIADQPALADEVRDFVRTHDGVAQAALVMNAFIDRAVTRLDALPPSEEKSLLMDWARFVVERNK